MPSPYKALLLLFWFCTILTVGKNDQQTLKLLKHEEGPENTLLNDFGHQNQNRRKRAGDGDGFFARPKNNLNIASLQNELAKVKQELKEFLHNGTSLNNADRTKLDSFMNSVNDLYKQLDNVKIKVDHKISNVSNVVENWLGTLKSLENQLEKAKINATKLGDVQRKYLADCTEDLKSRDFPKAEATLKLINNDKRINLLVKDVYAARLGNFDLCLEFANTLTNKTKKMLIYEALRYEMISNDHDDLVKLMKLYYAARDVDTDDTPLFLQFFKKSIHEIGVQKLERALRNNLKPSREIVAYCEHIDFESMSSAIDRVYPHVKNGDILLFLDDLPLRSRLTGYYLMLNRMPSNDEFTYSLEFRVMELQDHEIAGMFLFLLRDRGFIIMNIRSKVCLGSRQPYYYYLYNSPNKSVRRTVLGKKAAYQQPHQHWQLERQGNYFTITNVEFEGKLVVAEGNQVFTTAENLQENEGYWTIARQDRDLFLLKSMRNLQYLYVTNQNVDRLFRKVSTQMSTTNSSYWSFKFCQ